MKKSIFIFFISCLSINLFASNTKGEDEFYRSLPKITNKKVAELNQKTIKLNNLIINYNDRTKMPNYGWVFLEQDRFKKLSFANNISINYNGLKNEQQFNFESLNKGWDKVQVINSSLLSVSDLAIKESYYNINFIPVNLSLKKAWIDLGFFQKLIVYSNKYKHNYVVVSGVFNESIKTYPSIPDYLYSILLNAKTGQTLVWLVKNNTDIDSKKIATMLVPLSSLEEKIGIEFFPTNKNVLKYKHQIIRDFI
jgi:DNA/RNA endonuclease G (NUC1)